MKKSLSIGLVTLFVLAIVSLAGYGFWQYRNQKVGKIMVHIERPAKKGFLDKKTIVALIRQNGHVLGVPVKEVPVGQLKEKLQQNPYVDKADVYFDLFGDVLVNVLERKPLLRLYNLQGKSCYIDENGIFFPVSSVYSPRVLIANGYIQTIGETGENLFQKKYSHTALPALFLLARKVQGDPFLRATVSQLFVNSKGNLDMVPELGRFIIHLGDTSAINIKLENLKAFSKQVFAQGGWSKYKSINLEFTNQVVCTKK